MLIVFDSMTGNVKRFVEKLGMRSIRIQPNLSVEEDFVLITYTINFGEIPKTTREFLERNHKHLIGVSSSGNRNWGFTYGKSADLISQNYGVPLISKFELAGTKGDVEFFKERVLNIEVHRTKQ